MSLSITVVTLFFVAFATGKTYHPLSDEFISHINSKQSSWKAGRNFPMDTPLEYIRGLMGALKNPSPSLSIKTHDADLIADLPENFDSREKWPNCPSMHDIRDQGSCGSCWAFGAVEAMTDRVCTYSNGAKQFHFSAQDLVSCCTDCGYGCQGGYPDNAWQYWRDVGIVSGGPYNSSQGCRPYEIAPCEHGDAVGPLPKCSPELEPTPDCVDKCEAGYNKEYKQDKRRAKQVNVLKGEDDMKAEIYKGGPIEAAFDVYTDFIHYKSGVYLHTWGKCLGGHAIKVLGWGVEGGKKYWLCANSWNSDWGDKGFFKILRGVDHCGIESAVVAGEPDLEGF
ncbi:cathepsin B-like [Leguminivora glycinivorella]|uniref:cathepsin B-like n=1 Tax=Leguminivora glycinivorella TaxID=1035111 RepID=UPI00200F7525|nr:cathepsin B-like [Leguminivora glycinivorella]